MWCWRRAVTISALALGCTHNAAPPAVVAQAPASASGAGDAPVGDVGPVVLIDAGRAPQRPLRYAFRAGIQQTTTISFEMAIEEPPLGPMVGMKFVLVTDQAQAPGGGVRVTVRPSMLEMTSRGKEIPQEVRARINGLLQSASVEVVLTDRGLVKA
jgi:hypothetical protein